MIKIFLLAVFLTKFSLIPENIDFIGLNEYEIRQKMAKSESEFIYRKTHSSGNYKYLKFSNNIESKTLVFVLKNNVCTHFMIMYDNMYYSDILKTLNGCCHKQTENEWIEHKNNDIFKIYLKQGKWYFTLTKMKAEN
jgi:argonaute-like protein implicated in RNA metabolism and viral defense